MSLAHPFSSLIPHFACSIPTSHWNTPKCSRLAAVEPKVVQEVSAKQAPLYFSKAGAAVTAPKEVEAIGRIGPNRGGVLPHARRPAGGEQLGPRVGLTRTRPRVQP